MNPLRTRVVFDRPEQSWAARQDPLVCLAGLVALAGVWALGTFSARALVLPNVVVPPGFNVGIIAGPEVVEDARALVIHENGNVLVAGPGYLRILLDADGNGLADHAIEFAAPPEPGAIPNCLWAEPGFVYWAGSSGIWRYSDFDRDGVADGKPTRLLSLPSGEGLQSLVRGPDGWWYASGSRGASWATLLVRGMPPDGANEGALVRINPTFDYAEWLAGGFLTARRFAFQAWGDLFVADDGVNMAVPLPWQTTAGVWHLARGARHGWGRNTTRPNYYPDQTPSLASFGPARLTGLISYRHYQFPTRFRDGLFALDWANGRIWFLPLQSVGASYVGRQELFVDSPGLGAFTPIDAAVAMDGSLLVISGDRKSRSSLYRIQYVADPGSLYFATNWVAAAVTPVRAVLTAPEPLAAWSRAYWVAAAGQVGRGPFEAVAGDSGVAPLLRARAIEVLTEIFSGLPSRLAQRLAKANDPAVRARTAWSLGRAPSAECIPTLLTLAVDPNLAVRRVALEALLDRIPQLEAGAVQPVITANLSQSERRLRQLAARLASQLPKESWDTVWSRADDTTRAQALGLALLWREPSPADRLALLKPVLHVLDQGTQPESVVHALRLIMLALRDWSEESGGYPGFVATDLIPWSAEQRTRLLSAATRRITDENPMVAMESARLLALVGDDRAASSAALLDRATKENTPAAQLHYLCAWARLQGPVEGRAKLAEILLEKKPEVVQRRGRHYWPNECLHLVQQLLIRDPALANALIDHADFSAPANLDLVPLFTAGAQEAAARKFMAAVRQNPLYPWNVDLVRLLGTLPPGEAAPVLRPQWRLAPLREELVRVLARSPDALDRDKFMWGVGANDLDVVRSCLDSLLTLPKIGSPAALGSGARLLDRLLDDPRHFVLRAQALRWFEREAGRTFNVHEQGATPEGLRQAYRPIFQWLAQTHPAVGRPLEAAGDLPPWRQRIVAASQIHGNPNRGEILFRQRRCLECHHGPAAFGPDLGLVLRGVNTEDMFRSVLFPDERVRAGYRLTRFRSRQGAEADGVLIWESALGGLFNTGPNESLRFFWKDIADAQLLETSPMPKNLTGGMSARDLADLQAFLSGMGR